MQIRRRSIGKAGVPEEDYNTTMTEVDTTTGETGGAARTVLVTGASRGLGRGIALSLAEGGYNVAINYRGNRAAAEQTAADCAAVAPTGRRFVPIQGDISDRDDRKRLVAETTHEFGAIYALVNNAGVAPRERFDITEATEESFEELMRTNLQGPYFLTQEVVRGWLAAEGTKTRGAPGGGAPGGTLQAAEPDRPAPPRHHVVFVTSISAATVSLNRGEYCVSKAGLAMAVQLWAARLAGEGINVYEVRPGIMATDMTAGVKQKYDALIADGLVPQRRWGTPDDVGRSVRALVDGAFPFGTGSVIDADGGFSISRL
jgi:NAD(P)-dependent dehydrogenase (short-subunit alcohol dehydrogenase family)